MERVEAGSYVLIGGRNHRVTYADYIGRRIQCYWVAKPKDIMWIDWKDSFEVIGWKDL